MNTFEWSNRQIAAKPAFYRLTSSLLIALSANAAFGQHPSTPQPGPIPVELADDSQKQYPSTMDCVNDQRKLRTVLNRTYSKTPFAKGESMEQELRTLCGSRHGAIIAPSAKGLEEQVKAYQAKLEAND